MRILGDKECEGIWDYIYAELKFKPGIQNGPAPFSFTQDARVFTLTSYWTDEQEAVVHGIFRNICDDELYALDWQHDCFSFSPKEEIMPGMNWHDDIRHCQVYFPSYYPNGDYHFFVSKDFTYGMAGHPWRNELWVWGQKLIQAFMQKQIELRIDERKP